MKLFTVTKNYRLTEASPNSLFNKTLSLDHCTYEVEASNENAYNLTPKREISFFYNSFLPKIRATLAAENLTLTFSLLNSVKIIFFIMLIVDVLLGAGIFIKLFILSGDKSILPLLIAPAIFLFQFLFLFVGFNLSCKSIQRQLAKELKLSKITKG